MREDRLRHEPGGRPRTGKPETKMILHQALTKNADGNFEIDLGVIRQMAHAFDEGCHNDECTLAKFILAAFQCGFDAGVEEAEENHRRMAVLMMCTGGNA